MRSQETKIAIFASGNGTNAENVANYFANHPKIRVAKIFSNKASALVHERAKWLKIPSETFSKEEFNAPFFLDRLREVDYIVLAGFLWRIPFYLIEAYPKHILNIHPALLPKYGGKGMYGRHVHQAVVSNGEKESGITIHLVNTEYDEGKILFQIKCRVAKNETAASLADKVHALEYEHFPKVIEKYICSN